MWLTSFHFSFSHIAIWVMQGGLSFFCLWCFLFALHMHFLYYCYSQFSLLSSFGASFFTTCGIHFSAIVISWRIFFIGYLLFHYHFASINKNSLASLLPPSSLHFILFPYYYSRGARSFYLFWPLMCLLCSLNSFFLLLLFCEEQSSLELCCYFIGILLPLIELTCFIVNNLFVLFFFFCIIVQEVKDLFLIFVPLMFLLYFLHSFSLLLFVIVSPFFL